MLSKQTFVRGRTVSEYDDDYVPKFVHIIPKNSQTVNDVLADEVERWTAKNPVLICAQTGSGKTFFAIHTLIPWAIAHGLNTLIASNRIAASCQLKRDCMEMLGDERLKLLTDEGVRKEENFGFMKIMTLQRLYSFLGTSEGAAWCKGVGLLIIDEAHYFVSDAPFNPTTDKLLQRIPMVFNTAVRVYISSTPEDVLVPLAAAEERALRPLTERYQRYGLRDYPALRDCFPPSLLFYRFPVKYDYVDIRYFAKPQSLIEAITDSALSEKWLIFITSIEQGHHLADEIRRSSGDDDIVVLTAKDKDSAAWRSLVNNETLSHRITLATTVIDCGVNIKDDQLKHIVIYNIERATFIQCLGRKRRKAGERVTLYVPVPSPSYLSVLRSQVSLGLSVINTVNRDIPAELEVLWNDIHTGKLPLCSLPLLFPYKQPMRVNQTHAHALNREANFLASLEDLSQQFGDSAFPRLVHEWLCLQDRYNERNWLEHDTVNELRTALTKHLSRLLGESLCDRAEMDTLRSEVLSLAVACGKSVRKDRQNYLQRTALNNLLGSLGIPFALKGNKDCWQVIQQDDTMEEDGISCTRS